MTGYEPGMTREEYKRRRGPRPSVLSMNEAVAAEPSDAKLAAAMRPKVERFLSRIYDDASLQTVDCRQSGCMIEFETTEADGVMGLLEQAKQDLGMIGGGALGGAEVDGKPGRYSYQALLMFDRG